MNHQLIYENYRELVTGIYRYQLQQNEVRVLTVKLILGTIGVIGLLGLSNMGLSRYWFSIACAILPLLSLCTITFLMLNDLFYREQLKMGFFLEAARLEQEHSWIPEFHNSLFIEESEKPYYAPGKRQISFYKRCVAMLMFLSSLAFSRVPCLSNVLLITIIFSVFILVFIGYFCGLNYFIRKIYSPYHLKEKKTARAVSLELETFVSLLHAKGKDFIQNLSDIKMKYKNFTLTVITMIFLAAAYVAGSEENFFPNEQEPTSIQLYFIKHNKVFMISFLSFLSITGIGLIRYLDVILSYGQMRNLFKSLKMMERSYPNLAKPYTVISKTLYRGRFDPIILESMFYSSFNIGIIIFAGIIIMTQIRNYHSVSGIAVSVGMLIVLFISELISIFQTYRHKIAFTHDFS